MESIYLLLIAALGILAVANLIVGVSNDAVNFISSALGSKALSFKTIMIIATFGIFVGAVFSSGMMEVARKGIFVPSEFYFNEIMIIFMAVMIGNILLLDFFNTLGMPTSTTVSIVFNLLGAAVSMALIKIGLDDTKSVADIGNYINTEKAQSIIIGIFLSVIISFTIGMIVQWISRFIFTFKYERKTDKYGFLFTGVCLTAIGYFIFYKGLKGTPFYGSIKDFLAHNTAIVILGMFVFWSLLSLLLDRVFKLNVLHVVIGVGTFGLALAFAGNDLVNFIGVPMAAFHSYEAWNTSGVVSTAFSMDILAEKVPTEPVLLMLAGGIMVLTLWFSKKARTVAETSINLSRQGDAEEKFKPNAASRSIVRSVTKSAQSVNKILPKSFYDKVLSNFEQEEIQVSSEKAKELPAFDLIRASINLSVAGVLISIATNMKLPLSTTYVSFMVAMGTSLADRAWGRESAVYRVAGVLNVVGGWFMTALVAFLFAGILTYLIFLGEGAAIAVLLTGAIFLVARNYVIHKNRAKRKVNYKALRKTDSRTVQGIISESSENIAISLGRVTRIYSHAIIGIETMDVLSLRKAKKSVEKFESEVEELRNHLFYFIKNLNETSVRGSNFYILVLANLTDVVQSLEYIIKKSHRHVDNNHNPLSTSQMLDLREVQGGLTGLLHEAEQAFKAKKFGSLDKCLTQHSHVLDLISSKIDSQISRTRTDEQSPRNTTLYFNLLIETKDLVNSVLALLKEYHYSAGENLQ